jgi:hypothetical protein
LEEWPSFPARTRQMVQPPARKAETDEVNTTPMTKLPSDG